MCGLISEIFILPYHFIYLLYHTPVPWIAIVLYTWTRLNWETHMLFGSQSLMLTSLSMTWLFYVPLVMVLVPSWILSELSICGSLDMEWSVGCFPCGLLLLFSLLDPQTELEGRESEYRLEVLLMMLTIPQRSVLSSRKKKITWKAY